MTLKKFKTGWANYDCRDENYESFHENIQNINIYSKILIQSEQGIGDVIMFSSYYYTFLVVNLSFEIDYRLLDIYKYSFPNINFIEIGNIDKFHYKNFLKIRVGSLPQFYKRD